MLKENKQDQEKIKESRIEYIKSFDFGYADLTVDNNGMLLLKGRPIKEPYFSKGELELIVARLYVSLDPKLKVRFIDDFELLDEDNQKTLLDSLLEQGFQVITSEVGKTATSKNTILLRECKKVKSYEEKGLL